MSGLETNPGPSPQKAITLSHININSITSPGRLDELELFTSQHNIDILLLTETKLDTNVHPSLYALSKYQVPMTRHRNRHGGGVAAYFNKTLSATRLPNLELDGIEWIWSLVKIHAETILVCCLYLPPNLQSNLLCNFLDALSESISLAQTYNPTSILILGDFNAGNNFLANPLSINHSTISPFETNLKETIQSLNLIQLIDQPTRISQNISNLRDLVITSNINIVLDSGILPPFSQIDHFPTFVSLNMLSIPSQSTVKQIWDYANMDTERLAQLLTYTDWDSVIDNDIDTSTINFTQTLLTAAAETIPIKTVRTRAQDKPWVNATLKREIRKRDRLFKLAQRYRTEHHWSVWRQQRNLTTTLNRNLKENYLANQVQILLKTKKNPHDYHQILKNMLGRSKTETVPPLIGPDGIPTTNDSDKAELLGDFFAGQSQLDIDNDHPLPRTAPVDPPPPTLSNITVTEDEVLRVLNSIDPNKSTGSDNIPPKLLKMTAIIIKSPLTKLFNMSLSQGIFPTSWKEANVLPIFKKKGSTSDPTNYRPISLLPCLSKILEKIVFKRIYQHITENNILSERQSGYRPKHNTEIQLIYLINNIFKALDQGQDFSVIYLDISKYFDKIWHKGLIFKCENYCGISGNLLNWLTSYLYNRKQVVKVGNSQSTPKSINAGCPQGSVLGPLLALIYLNDLSDKTDNEILFFADDTTLHARHPHDSSTTHQSLQQDLHNIEQFGNDWMIKFNSSKTIQQTFTYKNTQKPPVLLFNGQQIPCATNHKHLGLNISTDMHFHEHINEIILKVNRALGPLYPLSRILPRHILNNIYSVYILPLFDYCDTIYDGHLTVSDSLKLERLHSRAGRLVTGALFRTPTRKLLEDLGWTTLKTRRDIHKLTTFHTLTNDREHKLPNIITNLIPDNRAHTTGRPLRNALTLTLPQNRTTAYQNSFIPTTVRKWNQLPPGLTSLSSSKSFKKEIQKCFGAAKPPSYFNFGHKTGNVLHARLRMGLSHLNSHKFKIQSSTSDDPSCGCGHHCEDTKHFILNCPLYHQLRIDLLHETSLIIPNFLHLDQAHQLRIYLNGENLTLNEQLIIANVFQKFILQTKRFSGSK